MLNPRESTQNEFEFVLVPDDHLTTGLFPQWKFTYGKERDLYIFLNN